MKKVLIIFAFFWSTLQGQGIKDYVINNIHGIRSIDPSDTNFADLTPLKHAIGDAQLVMLGEQGHGDAPCFLAKTRIIKYLHEQLDFDIVAFESDFYGITRSWDKHGADKPDTVINNIFPIWTRCVQCTDLFEYCKQNKITIAGFDSQHFSSYSYYNAKKDYEQLMQTIKFIVPKDDETLFWKAFDVVINGAPISSEIALGKFDKILINLALAIKKSSFRDKTFWEQELKNLKAVTLSRSHSSFNTTRNIRDAQMADNILWLLKEKFPSKKIIVWAHNSHIAKNINEFDKRKNSIEERMISLGGNVYQSLKDNVYILGFTSYQGTAGRVTAKKKYKVKKPSKDSFEKWVYKKGNEYAYINFQEYNKTERFKMKGYEHHYELNANWTNIFDGIFYIKEMYPCNKK